MFQFLKNPDFDFMSHRKVVLSVSAVVVLISVVVLATVGLNKGIEFTGGTELQLKFADTPDIPGIRSALSSAGMSSQSVTTIGDPAGNEVYIRLGVAGEESGDVAGAVRNTIRTQMFGLDGSTFDLNIEDEASIHALLSGAPSLSDSQAAQLAAAISEQRKEAAIFGSVDDLAGIAGMTPGAMEYLRNNSVVGPLAARGQSYIGPAIGEELMQKAMFAILGSLVGMLIYIWIRFQLQWGFAAVAALTHDTLITLGLFSLFGKEMSLPVVAAFLTLVGYSVNDTVVVFDRIRENLRNRKGDKLVDVVNTSINQTLSRTIITSGLTWVVVLALFVFGGAALNSFAFVLTVGVLVGTYSSIYVASPIVVWWSEYQERKERSAGSVGQPRPKKASI